MADKPIVILHPKDIVHDAENNTFTVPEVPNLVYINRVTDEQVTGEVYIQPNEIYNIIVEVEESEVYDYQIFPGVWEWTFSYTKQIVWIPSVEPERIGKENRIVIIMME